MLQESDNPQTIQPDNRRDFQIGPMQDVAVDNSEVSARLLVDEVFDGGAAEAVADVFISPIMEEIDAIYLDLPDMFSELDSQSKPEVIVSPASKELYAVADDIIKARNDLLQRKFFHNAS